MWARGFPCQRMLEATRRSKHSARRLARSSDCICDNHVVSIHRKPIVNVICRCFEFSAIIGKRNFIYSVDPRWLLWSQPGELEAFLRQPFGGSGIASPRSWPSLRFEVPRLVSFVESVTLVHFVQEVFIRNRCIRKFLPEDVIETRSRPPKKSNNPDRHNRHYGTSDNHEQSRTSIADGHVTLHGSTFDLPRPSRESPTGKNRR